MKNQRTFDHGVISVHLSIFTERESTSTFIHRNADSINLSPAFLVLASSHMFAILVVSTASASIQVSTDPAGFVTVIFGRSLRLACTGFENGNAVNATTWDPHPLGGFLQVDGTLYFHNYAGERPGPASFTCTKRSASGTASQSVQVIGVPAASG